MSKGSNNDLETTNIKMKPIRKTHKDTSDEKTSIKLKPVKDINRPVKETNKKDNSNKFHRSFEKRDINKVIDDNTFKIVNETKVTKSYKGLTILIIILIITIIIIVLATFLFYLYVKNNDIKNNNININETKPINNLSNIKYDVITKLEDGSLLVSIETNSNEFVTLTTPINYFDNEKNLINNNQIITTCAIKDNKLYTVIYPSESYDTYQILTEKTDIYYNSDKCIDYQNNIIFTYEENTINVLNKTGKKININGYLLYYKDNNIIGIKNIYFENVDDSLNKEIINLYDENNEIITYDKVEYVINSVKTNE